MNKTKNEYRPLAERKAPEEMTLPELVREFARIKVWLAAREGEALRSGEAALQHRRLGAVCNELEARGALD